MIPYHNSLVQPANVTNTLQPMIHAAVVCVSTAAFLLHKRKLGLVTGSLLFAPLLAAFGMCLLYSHRHLTLTCPLSLTVSAVMHVTSACLPETVVDENGNTELMTADWSDLETFNPKPVDDTTARLALLTRVMPLLLVTYHLLYVGLCDVNHLYAHGGTSQGDPRCSQGATR